MFLFPFHRFKIEGESMMPRLSPGHEVLVFSWAKVKVGDTIVFKKEAKTMIKKIERIEGQKIYVKGENGQKSTDSREFGSITKKQIIGKVLRATICDTVHTSGAFDVSDDTSDARRQAAKRF